jgi:hypothetical protein
VDGKKIELKMILLLMQKNLRTVQMQLTALVIQPELIVLLRVELAFLFVKRRVEGENSGVEGEEQVVAAAAAAAAECEW